jgi:hypothetical protein
LIEKEQTGRRAYACIKYRIFIFFSEIESSSTNEGRKGRQRYEHTIIFLLERGVRRRKCPLLVLDTHTCCCDNKKLASLSKIKYKWKSDPKNNSITL